MSFGGFNIGSGNGGDGTFGDMPNAAMAHSRLLTQTLPQPVFNSPPLSLAIKPKMEGHGEMGLIGENFDPGVMGMGRMRDDAYENRSVSDNSDGGSGDDQEAASGRPNRKKRYHRHTPFQIQELEAVFKENPHPDEKTRLAIGRKLNLESKQVKFWFQNRRTQMKTQLERHENVILRQENDKLRIENIAIKDAMRNPTCNSCGSPAILGEVSIEEHQLRIENARLKDELNRIFALANKFLGRPLSSLHGSIPPGMSNSALDLAMGRNGFGDAPLQMGLDFGNGVSNTMPVATPPRSTFDSAGIDLSYEKSLFIELAMAAMDELVKLAQMDEPIWVKSSDGGRETLNYDEYTRTFLPCIGSKPNGFITDATRATGAVIINSGALVETFIDENRWAETFSCLIGRTSIIDMISSGSGGTRNGVLQLMHSEIQVLSPLVPARQMKFLRFCKQHAEGVWAVVDVSVDSIRESSNVHSLPNCRRLPSGCILQDLPNGYTKVTWIEHFEYDESVVHQLYRPLLSSGLGFGAQKWVATLQRQCESLAIMSSAVSSEDPAGINPSGRRSMVKLGQRMTRNFCAGVCGTVHKWETLRVGNVGEDSRLMIRKNVDEPGEPPGVVLSATVSVWMPVSQQRLFDFLRNEQLRSEWDILSHGGAMQEMVHIAKGQDHRNCVSLLRASAVNVNQSGMLMLQETWTDESSSVISYAPVDIPAMQVVINGGDPSCVSLLPSGFAILPDGSVNNEGGAGGSSSSNNNGGGGSLLTMGFQILVNNLPTAKLTMESVETVNDLVSKQIQKIKGAVCGGGGGGN